MRDLEVVKEAMESIKEWLTSPACADPESVDFAEVSAENLIEWLRRDGFEVKRIVNG